MIRTDFERVKHVLCLGAHSDDIEIGCGGALLTLIEENPGIHVDWVVFSARGVRGEEADASAARFLEGAHSSGVLLRDFRDGFLPFVGAEVKEAFEELKDLPNPDLVFTQHGDDRHQDHRLVSELTWNTFRDHLILEYEIPKYDGDLSRPNFYFHLSDEVREKKVEILMEAFASQSEKDWFSEETFNGLMRLRGMESNAPSAYAEAFHCRKARH